MMVNNKTIFYTVILASLIVSCATKITIETINEPFEKDFEKYVKASYKEFRNYPLSFKEYYNLEKSELDRVNNIRKRVIDSLGLLNNSNWLLINQYGTNYSGQYEKTYIIMEDRFFFYDLPQQGVKVNLNKYEVEENDIKKLQTVKNKDIFNIYSIFRKTTLNDKVAEPNVNPLLNYDIIYVKDKKMTTYKISSENYLIKKLR